MNDWFDELYEDRHGWIEDTRKNKFERGIRQSTVDKYADPVHFVYELLQNAEDQEATKATFILRADQVIFQHNGNPFTRQDIVNITGLGNSAKPEQANKIGRYGIGFKSIFVITDEPTVHTSLEGKPFSFIIQDLVVPQRIAYTKKDIRPDETCFILPFKPDKVKRLYSLIQDKLHTLGADTLLFLRRLQVISWQTPLEKGTYRCNRNQQTGICHLISEAGCKEAKRTCEEIRYLVFSDDVHIEHADRSLTVQIAFRLGETGIEPEPGSSVLNVYFPTEEKTGLKFRLHAPFLLTDNRANVKRDEPINDQLIQAGARLLAKSLLQIRARKLLSVSCLTCLPIRYERSAWLNSGNTKYQCTEEPLFEPFFDAVREALRHERLLPTAQGKFVHASAAKIARSSGLRELLTEDVLTTLFEATEQLYWLSADITEDKTRDLYGYLRDVIGLDVIDPMAFAARITKTFLKKQTDEWMIQFYTFLIDQEALWAENRRNVSLQRGPILRTKPIVRLANNSHVAPCKEDGKTPNAFLSPKRGTKFPIVKRRIDKDEKAHAFFVRLGLGEPDILDDVMELILPRYEANNATVPDKTYFADVAQIAQAIKSSLQHRHDDLRQALLKTAFVRAYNAADADRVQMQTPEAVYVPTATLTHWFEGAVDVWFLCPEVSNQPAWKTIQDFLGYTGEVFRTTVPIWTDRQPRTDGHIYFQHQHSWHKRGLYGFTPKVRIKGLEHALHTITVAKAGILWELLLEHNHLIKGTVETATHQNFDNVRESETMVSDVGSICLENAWLPDRREEFHRPRTLSLSNLPAAFETQSRRAKKLALLLGMRHTEIQEAADKLDLPAHILADFTAVYSQNPQVIERFLASHRTPVFPQRASPNPARRAAKLSKEAENALPKTYELRERSVRTSSGVVKVDKKVYLRDLYTNGDDEMICQICHDEMPFRLDDGNYHFEAPQFLESTKHEYCENHLALCPNCAAKFQLVNGSSPDSLRQALFATKTLEVPITLAREQQTIAFVRAHLEDLRTIMRNEIL